MMDSRTNPYADHDAFPVRSLTFAVLITVAMFLWLSWHVYNSYRVGRVIKDAHVRTEEFRDELFNIGQMLVMSARMAVATGESRWRDMHRPLQRRLEAKIEEGLGLRTVANNDTLLRHARSISDGLRETEHRALELSRQAQRQVGLELLSGDEYQAQSDLFDQAIREFISGQRTSLNIVLRSERNKELFSIVVAFCIFLISLSVWLLLVRRIHGWQSAVLQEVSKRRRLEEELRQSQKMEAIGQLASGIAHDFSNLLTAISGYTCLAKRTLPGEHPAVQSLNRVEQAAEQANGVSRALLTYSRKDVPEKQATDLRTVVEKTVRLLRRMLPAEIDLQVHPLPTAPLWVNADSVQLQQVLMNLAINARDAMPNGGTLSVSLESVRANRTADDYGGRRKMATPFARLAIRDTGDGMPPEIQKRIFEPFFTTKPRTQGTGLGLSIVHGIVAEHQGHIEIESAVGKGSAFTIDLPTCAADSVAAMRERDPVEPPGTGELILLAENHAYVREIMATTLETLGYQVLQVADGEALFESCRRQGPSIRLYIIAIDLGPRSGLECLRQIRSSGDTTPAILISGWIDPSLEDQINGEALLLRKPFPMSEFGRLATQLVVTNL